MARTPYYVRQRDKAPAIPSPIPPNLSLPKVCIIGAGPSGITAAKTFHENRIPYDCFEKGPRIGGNWLMDNPNGVSACYETLHINTSCPRMAFSDFPMPADYPHYARHDQVLRYFESYVEHFNIGGSITFNTDVVSVEPTPTDDGSEGGWDVTVRSVQDGTTRTLHYDAVVVGNGHHWDPAWPNPDYPGHFAGEQMHAHSYRDASQLAGRDVVIVGAGSSAMDISVEASKVARTANVSIRRGQHILRKTFFGGRLATDQIAFPGWFPWLATRMRLGLGSALSGGLKRFGLPQPEHAAGESHPVQSDHIRQALATGRVSVRPGIQELAEDRVIFTDGTWAPADLIIWATGYKVSFPFLSDELLDTSGNEVPLWKRIAHPDIPGLFFLGLLQPVGAMMPLAEAQSRYIAKLLLGQVRLPEREQMLEDMSREHEKHKKRFYSSPRHTMQVDFDGYLHDMAVTERRTAVRA